MLFADLAERGKFTSTGIGEEYINLAVLLLDRVVQPVDICKHGHIPLHAGRSPANGLDGFVKSCLAATGDKDGCPRRCECFCRRETDATGSAGDNHNLVLEVLCHFILLSDGTIAVDMKMQMERSFL